MNRRSFIQQSGIFSAGALLSQSVFAKQFFGQPYNTELEKHTITSAEFDDIDYHWIRHAGRNARIGNHGQYHKCTILKLKTDKGAEGWGLTKQRAKEHLPSLIGKKLSDLIKPEKGISPLINEFFDLGLYDLTGKILGQPVYKLIGGIGTRQTPIYSGMIYFDEMDPAENPAGIDGILRNCEQDYKYGYRQLKVKIGRSGRWYPHDEGLAKDIEIIKKIHEEYRDKNVEILVDSNDMYSYDDTIKFLEGIGDVPIFWFEEPFPEEIKKSKKLKKWMNANGFEKTYYADGEFKPKEELCLEMGRQNILDVYLKDVIDYGGGFTKWINLMPKLIKIHMKTSPHAWGNMMKTVYACHIAAGLGNVLTLEGVSCESDHVDFGDHQIVDGIMTVSDEPGFGMKIIKK